MIETKRADQTSPMVSDLEDVLERAAKYGANCEVVARGHYLASSDLERRNLRLGRPVTAPSIIVGTAIFGTLQADPATWVKIATGLLSILAALISGLHTFLELRREGASAQEIRRRVLLAA